MLLPKKNELKRNLEYLTLTLIASAGLYLTGDHIKEHYNNYQIGKIDKKYEFKKSIDEINKGLEKLQELRAESIKSWIESYMTKIDVGDHVISSDLDWVRFELRQYEVNTQHFGRSAYHLSELKSGLRQLERMVQEQQIPK